MKKGSSNIKHFRPTWAEVDLSAIRHNLRALRACAGPRVKLLPVIKADAYGHGMQRVARTLVAEGVDFFGLANVDEAIALRKNGIKKDILLFEHALPGSAAPIVDYNLIQTVASLPLARALDRCARRKRRKVKVHLKVDTGMGRLGVPYSEALAFVGEVRQLKNVIVDGIYTHFPVADTNRSFTNEQIKKLERLVVALRKSGMTIPHVHAANSMGLVANYSTTLCNLARPGLMLYGMYPSISVQSKIKVMPALSVKSKIVFLKKISRGQGISYGRTFVATRPLRVATLPIGYNDGYFRLFSNNAHVLVDGKRCPVIGRVTMDQIVVDVTKVSSPTIGMEVVLLGRQKRACISADELARNAGTINYEITCSLGNRLPRVYTT